MPKISGYPSDSAPDPADIIPFVDVTAGATETVTVANLAASSAFAGQYAPLPAVVGTAGQVLAIDTADPLVTEWVTGGGGGGGAVDSVNGATGTVVLDADDIDDTSTVNKFATAAQLAAVDGIGASITAAINALLDGAPGALDTLNELAAAVNDDASFAATVTTALAGKQPLDGDLTTLSGAGNSAVLAATTASFTTADETKLDGIATGAQVNPTTIPSSVSVALSDMTTQITTGTTKAYWVNPYDAVLTITKVKATLATAGSGATVVDINEGAGAGTSILSTKITIDASETDSDDATTPPVISDTSIAADGRLTFDIDTAGTSAAGLMVHILFTRPA